MSLLHAHQTLLDAARPRGSELSLVPPGGALVELLTHAHHVGHLESSHPWELAPHVCRELEASSAHIPPGGWARLTGLAAGAGVVFATSEGFVPLVTPESLEANSDDCSRRMVEAFTRKLIPPAAAAALYVALDVHPLWGLELGREVGATEAASGAVCAPTREALPLVKDLVFGTLTGLLTSLRCLSPGARYPLDALGDVLWWSAVRARELACADGFKGAGLPIFLDGTIDQRRMLTTRLAVSDLLDFVFVPAGVARRDDSGWFAADREALMGVQVGDWDLAHQIGWWNEALAVDHRRAC